MSQCCPLLFAEELLVLVESTEQQKTFSLLEIIPLIQATQEKLCRDLYHSIIRRFDRSGTDCASLFRVQKWRRWQRKTVRHQQQLLLRGTALVTYTLSFGAVW